MGHVTPMPPSTYSQNHRKHYRGIQALELFPGWKFTSAEPYAFVRLCAAQSVRRPCVWRGSRSQVGKKGEVGEGGIGRRQQLKGLSSPLPSSV